MTLLRSFAIAAVLCCVGTLASVSAAQPLAVGQSAPSFAYHLLDGKRLSPRTLHGHPYVLWMVATWCPSCRTGSSVVGSHIAYLRSHGVRVVEMELGDDLGQAGPPLRSFQAGVGMAAVSPNWYWGELTVPQTATLDPRGDMDIYYLVNAQGKIVTVSGNPAVTWSTIAQFAAASR